MTRSGTLIAILIVSVCSVLACRPDDHVARDSTTTSRVPTERVSSSRVADAHLTPEQVVQEFGKRMKQVSTSAPPEVARDAVRQNYRGLVDPRLLEIWASDPARAPGRPVSSPWPDRIDIESRSRSSNDDVTIIGSVVEISSGAEARRIPVHLRLQRSSGGWLITEYAAAVGLVSGADSEPIVNEAQKAAAVVDAYYRAIASHDYEGAFAYWGSSGPPGQSLEAFAGGFEDTAAVKVETGTPSRVEPAAGSRYIEVPVTVSATTKSGDTQRFEGTYTLRRSVVDGAPPQDRVWHLYRASIRQVG